MLGLFAWQKESQDQAAARSQAAYQQAMSAASPSDPALCSQLDRMDSADPNLSLQNGGGAQALVEACTGQ